MFCIHCGNQLPDDVRFCQFCGNPVGEEAPQSSVPQPAPVPQSAPQPDPAVYQIPTPPAPAPKKSKAPLLIVLILAVALAVGGFLAYQNGLLDGILGKDDAAQSDDAQTGEAADANTSTADDSTEMSDAPSEIPDDTPPATETPDEPAVEEPPAVEAPYNTQELRVVTSGSTAQLSLVNWENGEWQEMLTMSANIGSNGITETKTEGDHCTPAGTYDILFAFGTTERTGLAMNYVQIQSGDVWVCDPDSAYYNTLQSSSLPEKDWDASENMYTKFTDNRSVACIYFSFNGDGRSADSAMANGGSALFLDGVGSAGNMTSGYGDIKISAGDMARLLQYLDSSRNPIIVIS